MRKSAFFFCVTEVKNEKNCVFNYSYFFSHVISISIILIYVTTHTFRYTHISFLAEAGVPIKAIMERVGHSNMKTTLEIYNQVTNTTKEKLVQEVDSWIC